MRWLVRFLFKAVIGFIGLSLLLVLLFRFVPVPVTPHFSGLASERRKDGRRRLDVAY